MKRTLLYLVPALALAVVAINATLCRVGTEEAAYYDPDVVALPAAAPVTRSVDGAAVFVAPVGSVSAATAPDRAPDFSWTGTDGRTTSLGSYRGKVVMINFWATWCPPCKRELPDIVKLREEHGERGFEVLGVSISERPAAGVSVEQHVADFASRNGLVYPLLIGNDRIVQAYGGIESIPTTVIVDREGRIARVINGMMSADEMREAVSPLL
jgi:cytochrome c biogenesis protein CcmG/thiol:disulfide interchange protein DsbE